MHAGCSGEDVAPGKELVLAVEVGDARSRLTGDHGARRQVPRRQVELEEPVEQPRRGVRQVEVGRGGGSQGREVG